MEMNAIGLRKILKKIDKRFGHKFSDYYVKTRANHPYSQLRQVFKHVVMFLSLNTTFFKFYFKLFESALPSCLMLQNVRWYDVVGSLFFIFCTLFVWAVLCNSFFAGHWGSCWCFISWSGRPSRFTTMSRKLHFYIWPAFLYSSG